MPNGPALEYPDAMAVVVGYLGPAMTAAGRTVAVRSRVPNPRPAELITITRTGGPELNLVTDGAQLTVDVWAASQPAVWDITAIARRLLHDAPQAVADVHRVVEIGGPQDLPDPVSNSPRVTFNLQVQTRGHAA